MLIIHQKSLKMCTTLLRGHTASSEIFLQECSGVYSRGVKPTLTRKEVVKFRHCCRLLIVILMLCLCC